MSKKSRRRNRRIAALLGGLGAVALATRKRNAAIDKGIQSAEDDKGSDMVSKTIMDNMPKKKKTVYQDPIMTGGKGVKQGFRTTSANVQKGKVEPPGFLGFKFSSPKISMKTPDVKFCQVVTKSGEKKTLTPFESSGLKFGIGKGKGLTQTQKAVNKANREMSEGMLPPQLRNPGRTNITTRQGENRQFLKNIANTIFPKLNLKDGGKVVKTGEKVAKLKKKKPIQIRGFGKARRG